MLELSHSLGAREAWVLTDRDNPAAMQLYRSVGGIADASDTVMFTFDLESSETTRDV